MVQGFLEKVILSHIKIFNVMLIRREPFSLPVIFQSVIGGLPRETNKTNTTNE